MRIFAGLTTRVASFAQGSILSAGVSLGLLFSLALNAAHLGRPATCWLQSWNAHRGSILMLTGLNVALTASTEFVSRAIASTAIGKSEENMFLKDQASGEWRIHRQSLINLLMTLFASLLGGPVYFLASRKQRFWFFAGFGVFNSLAAQVFCGIVAGASTLFALNRTLFDLIYNVTIKFFMFETWRPFLVQFSNRPILLSGGRIAQDLGTTMLRVAALLLLGLKG